MTFMTSRAVAWSIRAFFFAVVGVLTFVVQPPGATAVTAQFACYLIVGLGMLAWALIDMYPALARYRNRALPVLLGVIALAAGLACTAGSNENNCPVLLAGMASTAAGAELALPTSWLVSAASIVGIEANWLFYRDGSSQLSSFVLYPMVPVSGVLVGRLLHSRRVQAEQSAAMLAQTQQLLAVQGRADVLGERARIAREIHDVLAHSLGALGIQIQAARAVLTDHSDIDRAVEILQTAQRMAADGLTETRRAVHALRTDTKPLDVELERVTSTYGERYGVDVILGIGGSPRPVPPDGTVALLRTAQEALVNAAKHAPGQCVAVQLDYGEREVRLTVVNGLAGRRGRGAAKPGPGTVAGGYGLTGMQERLRLLNGTLTAEPRDGKWVVTAGLPLVPAPPLQDPAAPSQDPAPPSQQVPA
jgi:signal transduction histidine kinase